MKIAIRIAAWTLGVTVASVLIFTCYVIGVQGSVWRGLQKMAMVPAAWDEASAPFRAKRELAARQNEWVEKWSEIKRAMARDIASSKWTPLERDDRKAFFGALSDQAGKPSTEQIYQYLIDEAKKQLVVDGFW